MSKQNILAVDALGFLDSVFMSLCDIVGISDTLADHDSLFTQCYVLGKTPSQMNASQPQV